MDSHGNEREWRTRERARSSDFDDFRDYRGERDRWGNPLPDGRPGIWGSTYTPRYDRDPGDQPRRGYDPETRDYGPLSSPEYREPDRMSGPGSYGGRGEGRYGGERYGAGRGSYEDNSYPRPAREYSGERDSGSRYQTSRYGGESPRPEDFLDERDKSWSGQPGLPGGTSAFERLANAFTVLYTLPGVPLVYYGDEVAMPGAGDPDNRRFMQWSSYSAGQLLVKDHVSKLGAIRKAHSALRRGKRTSLGANADTMLYKMQDGSDVVYVAINRGDGTQTVGGLPSGNYTDELSGQAVSGDSVSVPARSAKILVGQ